VKCPKCDFVSGKRGMKNHIRHQHTDYETSLYSLGRIRGVYGTLKYQKNKEVKEILKKAGEKR